MHYHINLLFINLLISKMVYWHTVLLFYSFVTRNQTRKLLHDLTVVGLEIRPPIDKEITV